MKTAKEKFITMVDLLRVILGSSLTQVLAIVFLGGFYLFLTVFSEGILRSYIKNSILLSNLPSIVCIAVVAVIYGMVWLVFWNGVYDKGISWFYYRVAFLTIPLLALIYWFNPNRDPYAMRYTSQEHTFTSIVTCIILLPIYSVSIYKFILEKNNHKVRRTILVCTANLLLGVLIYASSWNLMFKVESTNLESESVAGVKISNGSKQSDVLRLYGDNCYRRSERDLMGDGGDYIIYVDREHDITMEFYFTVWGSVSRDDEGSLEYVTLKKGNSLMK